MPTVSLTKPTAKPKQPPWYKDPARREEHLKKMDEGRARAIEERKALPVEDQLMAPAEGEPDYFALMRSLRNVRWDRVPLSLAESVMGIIEETRREGLSRLETRRARESTNRCSYCGDPFPQGRFSYQPKWTDLETQQPVSRLCCAKIQCRQKGMQEEDGQRRKRLEARG